MGKAVLSKMSVLGKLFRPRPSPAPAATPCGTLPAGMRIYAIGDIHGRADLLDSLLERIAADDAARGNHGETTLIFLGDLIDRGPSSAAVVERLIALNAAARRTRFLLGNHEEVFLQALAGDIEALKFFERIGGRSTLLSYGIDARTYDAATYAELLDLLRASVPEAHVRFLESFEDLIVFGDYAFVHAGIDPATSLLDQKVKDLRWIRGSFLSHAAPVEKIIVHGHTIATDVEFGPHRIGIDTGAYASNRLTALGLEADQRWILQT